MYNLLATAVFLALGIATTQAAPVRVVCLGDSITKGVRTGVTEAQTYEALLQDWFTGSGVSVEIINVGIGGERTDQAIQRLASDVVARKPDIVTIMYGTNDSAVDRGEAGPRLPLDVYEENLRLMVQRLRAADMRPVLMTSPPLGKQFVYTSWSPYKEQGPNFLLIDYVRAVRRVAGDLRVPLVDNFAGWAEVQFMGGDIDGLMTDGCHPNPAGHELVARAMYPVLARVLGVDPGLPSGGDLGGTTVQQPPPADPASDNLALRKPYEETSHNAFGWDKGLTNGIKDRDGRDAGYATGDDDTYPKLTTIDLGQVQTVARVLVYNMAEGNTKTVAIGISSDGDSFEEVGRHVFQQGDAGIHECAFTPREARYVRISFLDSWLVESHGGEHFQFLREVEVFGQ